MLAAITAGLALLALITPLVGAESPGARVGWLLVCAAAIEMLHGLRRATVQARRQAAASALISLLIAFPLINASLVTLPALRLLVALFFGIDVVRYGIQSIRHKEPKRTEARRGRGSRQRGRACTGRAAARVDDDVGHGIGRRGAHGRHRVEYHDRADL